LPAPLPRYGAALGAATVLVLAALGGCTTTGPAARVPADGGTVRAAPPTRPGTGTGSGTVGTARPARLRIPAIGVDSSVMALGLATDGTVQVPPIAAHAPAGWYDGSPVPGRTGPSVILGHVTVGRYGDGVFRRLAELRAGDRVEVRLTDRQVAVFAVDSVRTVAKSRFPAEDVYGNVDRPALRLITCGGRRVAGSGGYPDNVLVFASLVGKQPGDAS
jgi:LPXTG-site transpeptidase (sortase) family protein